MPLLPLPKNAKTKSRKVKLANVLKLLYSFRLFIDENQNSLCYGFLSLSAQEPPV
jgi:hypothetical protein